MVMDAEKELKIYKQGAAEIISESKLKEKLIKSRKEKRPLIVKLGIDASASAIHLGSAVPLRKLRQFQDNGHKAVFLIGDFTGMIGDPSGQSKTRKQLTEIQVKKNTAALKKQIFKILEPRKTEIVFNSNWCKKMSFADVIKVASHYTVAQLLQRDDFENRFKNNQPIALHEFLYPLIQGYDSVVLRADVEICGTDQKFNCLVARALQEAYGQEPEAIIMMPILEGIGTQEKMSKSLSNYIGITESSTEMFGKTMRIVDEQIYDYFILATALIEEEIRKIEEKFENDPKGKKEKLAFEIVKLYHSKKEAEKAKRIFELKHGKAGRKLKKSLDKSWSREKFKKIAQKVELQKKDLKNNKIWICRLLTLIGVAPSNSEARRLIQQKGVKIDGEVAGDINKEIPSSKEGHLLEVGSRKMFYITFKL